MPRMVINNDNITDAGWYLLVDRWIFSAGCVVFLQLGNSDFVGSMAIYIFIAY